MPLPFTSLAAINEADEQPHEYPRPEQKGDDGMQEMVGPVVPLNNGLRNNLGLSCLHHHYVRLLLLGCMGGGGGGLNRDVG